MKYKAGTNPRVVTTINQSYTLGPISQNVGHSTVSSSYRSVIEKQKGLKPSHKKWGVKLLNFSEVYQRREIKILIFFLKFTILLTVLR